MNVKIEGRVDGKEIRLAKLTIKDGREGPDRSSISGIKLQFRPCKPPLLIWRSDRVRPCEQALTPRGRDQPYTDCPPIARGDTHNLITEFHSGVHKFHNSIREFHSDVCEFHNGVYEFHSGIHEFQSSVCEFHNNFEVKSFRV